MPNAPTHDFLTLVTVAGADVAYFQVNPHPSTTLAALFTVTYVFAGYACAGDLDLHSKEYKRWGPLRFIWLPYRSLVPHRSWISHGLVLGGVIRILYLALAFTLLFWAGLRLYGYYYPHYNVNADAMTRMQWQSLLGFTNAHPQETFAVLFGFILAGSTHAIADGIFTWFKRRF